MGVQTVLPRLTWLEKTNNNNNNKNTLKLFSLGLDPKKILLIGFLNPKFENEFGKIPFFSRNSLAKMSKRKYKKKPNQHNMKTANGFKHCLKIWLKPT